MNYNTHKIAKPRLPIEGNELTAACIEYFSTSNHGKLSNILVASAQNLGTFMRFAALATEIAHSIFDQEYAFVTKTIVGLGREIPCQAGCASCCKQAILSNPFETALIGMSLHRDEHKRNSFLSNYTQWDAQTRFMRDGYISRAEQKYCFNDSKLVFHPEEFTAHCPFLVDDMCQIYPVRPYSCRSYMALSEECKQPAQPEKRPGFQGIDVGAFTMFKDKRATLLRLLWNGYMPTPLKTRGRLLPELVTMFLNNDIEGLLRYCIIPTE